MVLITAFEPFGGRKNNASLEILNSLNLDLNKYFKVVLPVDSVKIRDTLNNLYSNYNFEYVVMLGESGKDSLVTLEKRAHNLMNFRIKDNGGYEPKNIKIEDGEDDEISSSINFDNLFNKDYSKYEFIESIDPGYFLCNMGYFLSLLKNKKTIFIHLPLIEKIDDKYKTMDKKLMLEEISYILEVLENGN